MSAWTCNVCGSPLGAPVYSSPTAVSITSLCRVLPQRTEVRWCGTCGHLQTPELADLAGYYAEEYRILLDSEDEDQIYEVGPGEKTFRADHQLTTLLAKVAIPPGADVLDYGCAKGATLRGLTRVRPDVKPHLFDVSDMYVPSWSRFSTPDRWAVHETPREWSGRFHVVTSFYALEHVGDPRRVVRDVARVLRPGGVFYAIVPDVYQNPGDLVVVDHVNHFSAPSLRRLLEEAGLAVREIDPGAHQSAFVAVAERRSAPPARSPAAPPPELARTVRETAEYWSGFAERVRAFEREHAAAAKAAIYGAGFYGTFLSTCLSRGDRVVAFLDQNPYLQGKTHLGKPVLPPADLPDDVEVLYVGLNPRRARGEIAKVPSLARPGLVPFWP